RTARELPEAAERAPGAGRPPGDAGAAGEEEVGSGAGEGAAEASGDEGELVSETARTGGWPSRPTRVQLLVTCLVDSIAPRVGFAVVEVLERLGLEVEVPAGQTCCGQPAFNSGGWDEARAMARHLIDVFGDHPDVPVVVPSGSCGDMVIHQAPMLLENDPQYADRARALAARTFEFTQFLVDVLGVTDVGAISEGKIAYHPSCHGLRGLGV